jgi:glucose/arabinose dehydrogenase
MKTTGMTKTKFFLLGLTLAVLGAVAFYVAHPSDSSQMDAAALPQGPAGFEVKLFAQESFVGNPAAMAFDRKGRLFVGMGPPDRNPQPETPGDRVVRLLDKDGDGVADQTKDFATGLNSIQGLAGADALRTMLQDPRDGVRRRSRRRSSPKPPRSC